MRRVLIIGIDGLSWNVIERLSSTQILSAKYIRDNTAYGTLQSTIPPWSIPAWNSLFTGVKPEKLSIFSFIGKRGEKLVTVLEELDDQVYLWDLASMYGKEVVAINIPCVTKAIPVNGYFVAGFLADRTKLACPCVITNALLRLRYMVDVTDIHPLTDEEYIETCIKMTIQRTALFLSLLKRANWHLGVLVYTSSDRIMHRFLKTRFSFVEKYYEVLDECIAKILDHVRIDEDTITFIVSDHGFKIPKKSFNINAWLASKGLLGITTIKTKEKISYLINHILSNNYLLLSIARR